MSDINYENWTLESLQTEWVRLFAMNKLVPLKSVSALLDTLDDIIYNKMN